jgi:FkbM family methyltransferase
LDVGANVGQFRDMLRLQIGFAGHIHSFEPIAALVEKLNERAHMDPPWSIHPFALGAERGKRAINVMASTGFSSFLKPVHRAVPELEELNTLREGRR